MTDPAPLLRVLHLSDLGVQASERWWQDPLLASLCAEVVALRAAGLAPDLVVITGDVAATGAVEEFATAEGWLRDHLLPAAGRTERELFLVPGERDVDPKAVDRSAAYILTGLISDGQQKIAEFLAKPSRRAVVLERLDGWRAFANRLRGGRPKLELPWWHEIVEVRGQKIGLAGLCSAWGAAGSDDKGRLLVGEAQASALLEAVRGCALRVALMHHPTEWLAQVDGRVEQIIANRADLLLRGHDPKPSAATITRHNRPLVVHVAGSALAKQGQPSHFALVEIFPSLVRVHPFLTAEDGWVRDRNRADNAAGHIDLLGPAQAVLAPHSAPPTRTAPAPDPLPERPYPILDSYSHPATFGGRDVELRSLLAELAEERLVLALYAPSGAGKSSLLRAGLLPALRGQRPAFREHRPAVAGIAARLLNGLEGKGDCGIQDGDCDGFARALAGIRDREGDRPVLILDQLEDIFDTPAPGWLGPLIAATAVAPGGRAARWVLAYRREFHGRVQGWLGDVLRYADPLSAEARARLPSNLRRPEDSSAWELPLLGEIPSAGDRLAAATAAFEDAILRPLALRQDGAPAYKQHIAPKAAHRLAAAFAAARMRNPDAPLTPELQVVLARLIEEAPVARDGTQRLCVPAVVGDLIQDAVTQHLKRKLTEITERTDRDDVPARRTLALLILARLVDDTGRRKIVPEATLLDGLGDQAKAMVDALKDTGVWLIRTESRCASLPHDHVAAAVRAVLRDPSQVIEFGLDGELVELWRLVDQRAAAMASGDHGAEVLDSARVEKLKARESAFPWSPATATWWKATQAAHRNRDCEETKARIRTTGARSGDPLRALHRLRVEHGLDGAALASALAVEEGADAFDANRRDELFGVGPAGLSEAERGQILPGLVEALAEHVAGAANDESLWGALLAAADAARPLESAASELASTAVVSAMRRSRGEPPRIDAADGSWTRIVSGTFSVGCFREVEDAGQTDEDLHEVTLSPYRMRRFAESLEEYWAFSPRHRAEHRYRKDWPALDLSWYEARAYAAWRGAWLPTEAQWEVAARGGDPKDYRKTAYFNGRGVDSLEAVGKYAGNQEKQGGQNPLAVHKPVPGAPSHPLGLVHIHGNMATWTMDWYAPYPADPSEDPCGPSVPPRGVARRVLRGGSWDSSAVVARSAFRVRDLPSVRSISVGLRLVLPQPRSAETGVGP